MSNESSSDSGGGIGFVGLLTIVFITLKLTNYIDWSWWWVLSPLWISGILVLMVVITIISTVSIFSSKKTINQKLNDFMDRSSK